MSEKVLLTSAHSEWLVENSPLWLAKLRETPGLNLGQQSVYNLGNSNPAKIETALKVAALIRLCFSPESSLAEAQEYVRSFPGEFLDRGRVVVRGLNQPEMLHSSAQRLSGLSLLVKQLLSSEEQGLIGIYDAERNPEEFHQAVGQAIKGTTRISTCHRSFSPMLSTVQAGQKPWLSTALQDRSEKLDSMRVLLPDCSEVGLRHAHHVCLEQEKRYQESIRADIEATKDLERFCSGPVELRVLSTMPMPYSLLVTDSVLLVEPHCPVSPDGTFCVLEFARRPVLAKTVGTTAYDRLAAAFEDLFKKGNPVQIKANS